MRALMFGDPFDDEPAKEDVTPPPLLIVAHVIKDDRDWHVVYVFYLGPLEGQVSYIMGPVGAMDEKQAHEKAKHRDSPFLKRAQLALLNVVPLEAKH